MPQENVENVENVEDVSLLTVDILSESGLKLNSFQLFPPVCQSSC